MLLTHEPSGHAAMLLQLTLKANTEHALSHMPGTGLGLVKQHSCGLVYVKSCSNIAASMTSWNMSVHIKVSARQSDWPAVLCSPECCYTLASNMTLQCLQCNFQHHM